MEAERVVLFLCECDPYIPLLKNRLRVLFGHTYLIIFYTFIWWLLYAFQMCSSRGILFGATKKVGDEPSKKLEEQCPKGFSQPVCNFMWNSGKTQENCWWCSYAPVMGTWRLRFFFMLNLCRTSSYFTREFIRCQRLSVRMVWCNLSLYFWHVSCENSIKSLSHNDRLR